MDDSVDNQQPRTTPEPAWTAVPAGAEWVTPPARVTAAGRRSLGDRVLLGGLATFAFYVGASILLPAPTPAMAQPPATATGGSCPATAGAESRRIEPSPRPYVPQPISILLPIHDDYVSSSTIVVAGWVYARPHGPRIRTVHVELAVAGRVVDRRDLDVHASRYAGVVSVDGSVARGEAEVRVTVPADPSRGRAVQRFVLKIPPPTP